LRRSHRTVLTSLTLLLGLLAVALSSSDRIDLAGGHLPFKVTPFLALSPCFLALALMDFLGLGAIPRSALTGRRWLPVIAFVLVAGVSTLLAENDYLSLGMSRYLLLAYLIGFAGVFAIYGITRGVLPELVSKGAAVGLAVYTLVSIAQLLGFFVPALHPLLQPGDGSFVDLTANLVGGVSVPRLSGLAGDPNRGAVSAAVFTIFYFLFAQREKRPYRVLVLGAGLVLLSWSRTGLLFYAIGLFFVLIRHPRVVSAMVAATAAGAIVAAVFLPTLSNAIDLAGLIEARTSQDVSTVTHFQLVQRAVTLGFDTDLRTTLIGVGYGTEYSVTQEFFPDNVYANFHSNALSVLAQTGLIGLLLFLLYSLWDPIRTGIAHGFRAQHAASGLSAAYFVAGLFYQYLAEPMFWLVLGVLVVLPLVVIERTPDRIGVEQ